MSLKLHTFILGYNPLCYLFRQSVHNFLSYLVNGQLDTQRDKTDRDENKLLASVYIIFTSCFPDFTTVLTCDGNPCENGGTCVEGEAGNYCECPPGIGGSLCTTSKFYNQDKQSVAFMPFLDPATYSFRFRVHASYRAFFIWDLCYCEFMVY